MTLVTRENLGAWVLKCNPQVWDLGGFLDDGNDYIDSWSVVDNYRTSLMEPGDRVIFWVSGPLTGRLARGIWGLGHVTGSPGARVDEYEEDETEADAEEPVADDGVDTGREPTEGYWIDLEKEACVSFFVPIFIPLLTEPIKSSDLLSVPATADIEVVAQPFGSNPSFISSKQLTLLTPHLPDWPETPGMARRRDRDRRRRCGLRRSVHHHARRSVGRRDIDRLLQRARVGRHRRDPGSVRLRLEL